MAKYDDKTMEFACRCYDKLKSLPYCSEVSTSNVISMVLEDFNTNEIPDATKVHFALADMVKSDGAFVMDDTKYFMQCVGLPEFIPYFFRPKHPLGWALFQNLLRIYEGLNFDSDEYQYAKEIIKGTNWETVYYGYDVPIPLSKTFIWLERAYKKNCRLKVVPDPEFQEGGRRYSHCDGWRYHYELDLENPPVF